MDHYLRRRSVLDKSITVRDILRWVGIVLGIAAVIAIIIAVPYSIGYSRGMSAAIKDTNELAKNVRTQTTTGSASTTTKDAAPTSADTTSKTTTTPDPTPDQDDDTPVQIGEEPTTTKTDETLDQFRNFAFVIDDEKYELRGDDWGSITDLELTLTNNENVIARPKTLKIKVYDKGAPVPDWWDDTIDVTPIGSVYPKKSRKATVAVHLSYTDKSKEKIIEAKLYNVNGLLMGSARKTVLLS